MKITLPVSGKAVEIVSLSVAQVREITELERRVAHASDAEREQAALELSERRAALLDGLYPGLVGDEMPARDAAVLRLVTLRFTYGDNAGSIKNYVAGLTGMEQDARPTA